MNKPTTEELKDLLGKVTKPWRYEIDEDDGVHVVHCAVIGPYPHISTSEPDLGSGHMKLIALAPTLAAEVVRLREALVVIAERHIPDQPAAYGGDEADWARRQHTDLRRIARQALSQK